MVKLFGQPIGVCVMEAPVSEVKAYLNVPDADDGEAVSSDEMDSWFDTEDVPTAPPPPLMQERIVNECVNSVIVSEDEYDDEEQLAVLPSVVQVPVWEDPRGMNAPPEPQAVSELHTDHHQDVDGDLDEAMAGLHQPRVSISSEGSAKVRLSRSVSEPHAGLSEDDICMDYLGKATTVAEARLAARRQARAEAREIRMRELERQQKEAEENADRHYEMYSDALSRGGLRTPGTNVRSGHHSGSASYQSSRRSSEDSTEDGINVRDIRHELKETEDKFRKAMIQNAQLDNEKASLTYQVELLKDRIEDMEEAHVRLQHEHKNKCREHEQLKRTSAKLQEEFELYKAQLEERDRLITEYGLVLVGVEVTEDKNGENGKVTKLALVSQQSAELLQQAGEGSLDVRLKQFAEEKNDLSDQIRRLKLDLEEERGKTAKNERLTGNSTHVNGPDVDILEVQREATKLVSDYKFRLQKAEQEVATLQANVTRLESQVIRYKSAAESSEKLEDELKAEKRKLQRELRETHTRLEEVETTNTHLQRRLDKLKNAKSALLKEL